ncbi:MAG: LTA synthase family protein [Tissierellia bacterium]|nr:LTA synthase family protein [Tissierellia bacterium]
MFHNPKVNWATGENYWRVYVSYQDSKIMELNGFNDFESTSDVTINYPSIVSIIGQYLIVISAIIFLTIFFVNLCDQSIIDKKLNIKRLLKFILNQIPKAILVVCLFLAFQLLYDNRIADTPLYLFGISMKKYDMFKYVILMSFSALGLNYLLRKFDRASNIYSLAIFFLNPLISFLLLEFAYNPSIGEMSILYVILNSLMLLGIQGFIFMLTRSRKISTAIILIVAISFGIVNDVLMTLRDSPLIPAFLGMLGVAGDVAGDTVIEFSGKNISAFIFAALWLLVLISPPRIRRNLSIKKYFIPLISYSAILFAIVIGSSHYYVTHAKVGVNLWRPSRTYYVEGSPFSFYRLAVDQMLKKPDNYSAKNVEDVLEKYYTGENLDPSKPEDKSDKKPNIIMIQSEALADYFRVAKLKLTENPLEFTRSLKENTIQGNLHVSVLGGGTVNTEYEALTGNSLSFFPGGSYPFQQYVNDGATSIGRLLENQGYDTYITHPNKRTNYSREEVWGNLGFKNMEFLNAYTGDEEEDSEAYKKANSDDFAHGHVSDKAVFERIEEKYKNKSDKPLFSYVVTMQNHGSYPGNYQGEIEVEGHEGEDAGANEFINLVKKSDDDFKELVDFFTNFDEPTIICIYGDHQPQNYKYFMDIAYGPGNYGNYETHYTPLTIWANYDIKEEPFKEISANYLSAYLFSVAGNGLKLSAYQNYQLDMMRKYPIMTRFNNKDDMGQEVTEDSNFLEKRNELDNIIYYNVKDSKRDDKFFIEPAEYQIDLK